MTSGSYSEKLIIAANQNLKERDYWLDKLSQEPVKTTFFYDDQTPLTGTGSAGQGKEAAAVSREQVIWEFSGEVFQRMMKLRNDSDARLHMILATVLVTLLHKYTGNTDIIVGTPIYKQEVGKEFINTVLALRNRVEENMTFKELLLQVRKTIVEAVENQNYPIEILVEQLNLPMVPGEFPLFDVVILLENIQDESYLRSIDYNVLLAFKRIDDSVEAVLAYNPLRYQEATAQRIAAHFSLLFETVLWDVNRQVNGIEILSGEERKQLLEDFNHKTLYYPKDKPFHRLFEDQAERTPDKIAIVGAGGVPISETVSMTYKELNKRANQLAQVLIAGGVGQDAVVAIMVDRSIEVMVGIMATMKAGGAYLPVDPAYPQERIAFMLEDSKTRWLITQEHLEDRITSDYNGAIIDVNVNIDDSQITQPGQSGRADHLVYVIYTSGSTGKPKGVMVQHNHFVNAAVGWRREYRLQEMEVNLLQMASFSFDVFAGDIARTFLNGGKMVINPAGVLDPESLYRLITIHRVTLFESTPSYIIPFMDYVYTNHLPVDSMRLLILGSDSFTVRDFKQLLLRFGKQMRIINSYGVTEATIDSSYYEENGGNNLPDGSNVPIGRPLPNMRFYILNTDLNPGDGSAHGNPGNTGSLQPVGVPGELYVGGESVTRGYLYREELTTERFLPDPFIPGQRMYKTGDLARWLPDGNVQFLGRSDYQIKIRGFRIELGEIENKLLEHEDIKEAVLVQKGEESDDKYLCGYFVSNKPLDSSQLRNYLGQKLPDYMIPWFFIQLEQLPLTHNGKIDRKALPEPESNRQIPYVAPRDETEKILVDIWSHVLPVEKEIIGIDTNFFDLGGNSLRAIVTTSRIYKAFNVKMQLTDIFEIQTIRGIAELIKKTSEEKFIPIEPTEEKEYYKLSSAQKRLYILQQMDLDSTVYNMPQTVQIQGGLEKKRLETILRKLIERHESLRTCFEKIENEPVQRVRSPGHVRQAVESYGAKVQDKNILKDFVRPFDLTRASLLRVGMIVPPGGSTHFILMVDLHHIICDAVSQETLVRDIMALYEKEKLSPLRIQYKDFSEWQNSERQKRALKQQETYWLKQFEEKIPEFNLPTDYSRDESMDFEGSSVYFHVGVEDTKALRQIVLAEGITIFMLLLAAYNILLLKLSGLDHIVIGAAAAGRSHPDMEQVIGMFVNTLALVNYPSNEKTFIGFLREVKERVLKAFDNQDYQFEDLVDKVLAERKPGRSPLFDVMFAFQTYEPGPGTANYEKFEEKNPDMDHINIDTGNINHMNPMSQQQLAYENRTAKFDLMLEGKDVGEELFFTLEYSTKLFKKETIQRYTGYFKEILSYIVENKEVKLKDIQISHDFYGKQLDNPQINFGF